MKTYLGLDLGGTNVKVGLLNRQGDILARAQVPTQAEDGPDKVIAVMADAAMQLVNNAGLTMDQVAKIGIGSPGPIDFAAGVVKAAPNIPGWRDIALRDRIAAMTGRPAVLENDANVAAFGEFRAGAGRDESIRHMVMLTLGTGIGSGLIHDGKLIHGGHGLGAEAGHMIVEPGGRLCGCGQRGCLEAYASAASTARRAAEALQHTCCDTSSLRGLEPVTCRAVCDAAGQGDRLAIRIIDETARYLAQGCINLCRLLDPQMIIFAGGMSLAGDLLFDRVRSAFASADWSLLATPVAIVPAQLGNDAGFIGAAAVARDTDSTSLSA